MCVAFPDGMKSHGCDASISQHRPRYILRTRARAQTLAQPLRARSVIFCNGVSMPPFITPGPRQTSLGSRTVPGIHTHTHTHTLAECFRSQFLGIYFFTTDERAWCGKTLRNKPIWGIRTAEQALQHGVPFGRCPPIRDRATRSHS